MNEIESFKITVNTFMQKHGVTPSGFGRKYAGDPNFVYELNQGREPKVKTRQKVLNSIASDLSLLNQTKGK